MREYRKYIQKKEEGSILDCISVIISLLAMSLVMLSMFSCAHMLQMKSDVGQVCRQYLLRMETVGYLSAEDKQKMAEELTQLGVTQISFCDTTCTPVNYGDEIILHIQGKIKGEISDDAQGLFQRGLQEKEFRLEERKTSTAKH